MRLERDGNGWRVVTSWNDALGRVLVKKAGFEWQPARKVWTSSRAAVAAELLRTLREEDEVADDVAEAVRQAVIDQLATASEAIQASRAISSDFAVPAPEGLDYLPYQKAGVGFLRDRLASGKGGALLADEMGLGKTIQVIGYMNVLLASFGDERRLRALVIAPKIALINWQRELEKWLIKPHSIAIWTTKAQPAADIVIVNYDIVAKLHAVLADDSRPWDVMACDESHALKDAKAQRTKAVLGGKGTTPIPADRRIFMTGTPLLNRPIELFPVLKNCGVDYANDYFRYARQYCGGHDTRFGFDASGATNLDDLQEKLRSSVMVRRLKADVLAELPEKRHQVVTIDPADSAALRKALRDEAAGLEETEKTAATARAAVARAEKSDDKAAYDEAVKRLSAAQVQNLAVIAKLRQQTALAKVPFIIGSVTATLESVPDAVLVFAHHRQVIADLEEGFRDAGYEPAVISGETSAADRQQAQDDIQAGRKRVFIGSIQACGVAITLTAATTVVFAELDWTPGRMVQAEDRAHRIGQKNAVLVQYLVVDGSIDADMLKKTWAKAVDAAAALDGQAGEPEVPPGNSEALGVTETMPADLEELPPEPKSIPEASEPIIVSVPVAEIAIGDIAGTGPRREHPPLSCGPTTAAERSRHYRLAHVDTRILKLSAPVADRLMRVAQEAGSSQEDILTHTLETLERA